MFSIIFFILVAITVYALFFYENKENNKKTNEPNNPPTTDVLAVGCNNDCGYATPEFITKANGNFEFTDCIYCAYQNKNVKRYSECKYAVDHPDKLSKGAFDALSDCFDDTDE